MPAGIRSLGPVTGMRDAVGADDAEGLLVVAGAGARLGLGELAGVDDGDGDGDTVVVLATFAVSFAVRCCNRYTPPTTKATNTTPTTI